VRGKLLAAVLLLAVVAGGSFLLGRILFAHDAPVEAHLQPTDPCASPTEAEPTPIGAENLKPAPTPTPSAPAKATPCLPPQNPTVGALSQQLEAEAAKPKFVGELNGFIFGESFSGDQLRQAISPKCSALNGRPATETEAKASALYFTPKNLPATAHQRPEIYAGACDDEVLTIGLEYQLENGLLTIYRYRSAGPPLIQALFPADRLRGATIGRLPAVIAAPLSNPSLPRFTILMREEKGYWRIDGRGLSEAELIKVAEGVQ
jgi:hypothetical protein